jgi:uncharacterized membrane protein YfcA
VSKVVAASFVLLGLGALAGTALVVVTAIVDDGDAGTVASAALGMALVAFIGVKLVRHGVRYWRGSVG